MVSMDYNFLTKQNVSKLFQSFNDNKKFLFCSSIPCLGWIQLSAVERVYYAKPGVCIKWKL